jgi:hypothetical protein
MLLITNFLELRWQIANIPSPCRDLTTTLPRPYHDPAIALRSHFQKGIFVA